MSDNNPHSSDRAYTNWRLRVRVEQRAAQRKRILTGDTDHRDRYLTAAQMDRIRRG